MVFLKNVQWEKIYQGKIKYENPYHNTKIILRVLFNQKAASPIEIHYFYDLILLLTSLEILWVDYF